MAGVRRDAGVVVAKMVEAALAGGLSDDRRRQDHCRPSRTDRGSVRSPIEHRAGARPPRVYGAPVRTGGGGGAARVGGFADLGDRRRPWALGPHRLSPFWVQRVGGGGVGGRGGGAARARGI